MTDEDEIVQNAMQIILHAGDARLACKESINSLLAGNIEDAKKYMEEADADILEAHHIQTDCIQGAVRGDPFEYNVLFTHAQDTLMTIYSEIKLAKQLTDMYINLDARLKVLEEKG